MDETNIIWEFEDFNPGISVDEWIAFLTDKELITKNHLRLLKCIKDVGGEASCKQLSEKYGESYNFYISCTSTLAQNIAKKINCDIPLRDNGKPRYWTILFYGRNTSKNESGYYVWKLRNELSQALESIDLSDIELYSPQTNIDNEPRYWWLNANPKYWSYSNISLGEEKTYTLFTENGAKRRIFQNFLDAKPNDIIIGYESTPKKQVVAICKVTREQDGENFYFEKIQDLINPIDYSILKDSIELENMEFFKNAQGSLFKLTKDEFDFIINTINENNNLDMDIIDANISPKNSYIEKIPYTKEDFLNEVYMEEEKFYVLTRLLKNKKNIILQGAPGVGKTFSAKRLAYVMMGEKNDSRVEFIQFHQNYSYEDFIMGYKPNGNGFKLTNGTFYKFCINASNNPDKDYFFIIDEINRANMSKVFGELLMLIEKDYRGVEAILPYNGKPFCVPKNVYIIGMMNTADRSLSMIDYALRRRFSFFEITPGFNSYGFKKYQKELNNTTFNIIINNIKELNEDIKNDDSLGSGFCIGHSYFLGEDNSTKEWIKEVIYYDIMPTLQEYWFDNKSKVEKWSNKFSGALND